MSLEFVSNTILLPSRTSVLEPADTIAPECIRSVRVSQLYVPEKIVIVPRPVTTLNNGRVTEPVDIMTVFVSVVILFCCGTIAIELVSPDDHVDVDHVSMITIGRIVPV